MQKIVAKFGGTSMGSSEAMLRSAEIAIKRKACLIVVSATSGTTDQLINLINYAEANDEKQCQEILSKIKERHLNIARELSLSLDLEQKLHALLNQLSTLTQGVLLLSECSPKAKAQIQSFGEIMSSLLFTQSMKNKHAMAHWLDARKILRTDSLYLKATPDIKKIEDNFKQTNLDFKQIYVTQGFIGADEKGATTLLGRGGSDYSAALMAEGIHADSLEIWTDVPGILTTDPRITQTAKKIDEITFNEASEMAQYGAKVLHPTTLWPAMRKEIPVFVGNSFDLSLPGTWIKRELTNLPLVRAITKRSKQALLTIQTPKMLNAFGFMAKIFEIFAKHRISVDCVTTSEISVAITVDLETLENQSFIAELAEIGELHIEKDFALISIIGNGLLKEAGVGKKVLSSVEDINIRMMSLGASEYNFNFLVQDKFADACIKRLHHNFIESSVP